MRGRRGIGVVACAAALGLAGATPARAQSNILTAGLGTLGGMASGGYVSLAVVVARARAGNYVYSANDVLGWGSVPVLIGAGSGALLGWLDPPRLLRTVVGGTAGTFAGMGIGLVIGRSVWRPPEGKWAGAAIGAGVGLVTGALIGGFWPTGKNDSEATSPSAAAVPIGITFHF